MEYDQGHGVVIKGPDKAPFKKLDDCLLLLWKLEFESQDIIDHTARTLERFENRGASA